MTRSARLVFALVLLPALTGCQPAMSVDEAKKEIQSIARAVSADAERDVFLGARANERAVKSADLSAYRVLAFATHGLVPGELDGLSQPALALSAPDVAEVDGAVRAESASR